MSVDVLAARSGDLVAFERLVDRWKATVSSIALGILRDVASAEDVAQDVFVTVWSKLATLDQPDSFGPWIRQITRNHALSRRRARGRRHERVVANGEAVERAFSTDPHDEAERARVVQDAIEALPEDSRDVLLLFYREGQSVRQVAELLDLSEGAVKKRLSRARQAVRAEVLSRLQDVATATAPGAAFTAVVLASVAPAPAAAAVGSVGAGATLGGAALAVGLTSVLTVLLGYGLASRVTRPERLRDLHRARNLTLGSLLVMLATGVIGPWAALLGLLQFIGVLGGVQFRILPRAFSMDDPHVAAQPGARIGRVFGFIGFVVGAACGLAGALAGIGAW